GAAATSPATSPGICVATCAALTPRVSHSASSRCGRLGSGKPDDTIRPTRSVGALRVLDFRLDRQAPRNDGLPVPVLIGCAVVASAIGAPDCPTSGRQRQRAAALDDRQVV